MFGLNEFTKTFYQELYEGVPFLGPDGPLDVTSFESFPGGHNVEELSGAYRAELAGTDLLPAEGSREEAELMRILEESGLCVNPSTMNLDNAYGQGLSAFQPNTAFSGPMPASDKNQYPIQAAAASQSLSWMPDFPMPTAHPLPSTQILPGCFAMADDTATLPPISSRKRPLEYYGAEWPTSKRGRWRDASTAGQIFPPTHPISSRFSGAYGNTEGNALEYHNFTTRTFGSEGYFPAAGSVPVSVPLSSQGLWPTMTSSAASATRQPHTQMPFMTAGYSDQTFSLPFGAQPTFQQPAPMLPWGAALESSMPYMPTGYGLDVPQPSFNTAGQTTSHHLPWPSSADIEDPFSLRSMPSMLIESGFDAPFAHASTQLPDQGWLTRRSSSDAPRSRQPRRAFYTSPAQPLPCSAPIARPTFYAGIHQTGNQLPSVGIASETSGSSSSARAPSAVKPKGRTQPPRASTLSSSTKPSPTKPQRRRQPPRAASSKYSSKAASSAKSDKQKQSPPQTSGSSSSSKAPLIAKPKKRKPPQTPYDPNGVGCHICKGGFTKQSEVTKHLKTNKHRLNLLALLYPELKISATRLRKNYVCPIDGCGEGMSRPWVLKRHLKDVHGVIAKKANVENVDDADGESVDDADRESVGDVDADEEESD